MDKKEWSQMRHSTQLNVGLLHAYYIEHAYPRHSHDYYVISLIERGNQSFTHRGTKHLTQSGGVILINPGEVHTGEATDKAGFELYSLYPTIAHMETAAFELTGRHRLSPFFKEVRTDNRQTRNSILSLHKVLLESVSPLEYESRFIWTLSQLIKQYADTSHIEQRLGKEKRAIRQALKYIHDNVTLGVSLHELGRHVGLSPY